MSRIIVKCSRCGWVHVVLTPDQIAELAPTPEEQARYRRCGGMLCNADPAVFLPTRDSDVAAGATMPGCIPEPEMQRDFRAVDGAQ